MREAAKDILNEFNKMGIPSNRVEISQVEFGRYPIQAYPGLPKPNAIKWEPDTVKLLCTGAAFKSLTKDQIDKVIEGAQKQHGKRVNITFKNYDDQRTRPHFEITIAKK